MGSKDGNGLGASVYWLNIAPSKGCGVNGHPNGNGQSVYGLTSASGDALKTGNGYSYNDNWPQIGDGDAE